MINENKPVHIVGAGLAGSECAWQLAQMGFSVKIYEMRNPGPSSTTTEAHKTAHFAELVCSNSLGSQTDYSAPGQLKWEAEQMNSLVLSSAKKFNVPAGMALAVDRERFSKHITETLRNHPLIEVIDQVVEKLSDIPRPAVIATGPLTHSTLALDLKNHFDDEFLYFFDAIAPVIDTDSIQTEIAFKADRFGKGHQDYYNCGMNREQYYEFVKAISLARKVESKDFEKNTPYFSGCMPIETMIERGLETPRFGPMSPKGIKNPRNHQTYYAVVQLRQENKEGTAYNMVGFQTKMAYQEQQKIFRMIPDLEEAEFLKLGSIHRNLYIQTPKKLTPFLQSRKDPELFFAGQITGVEGYFDSTCIGIIVAKFVAEQKRNQSFTAPPRESAMGSLLHAITEDNDYFQPTNINFGLFPNPSGLKIKSHEDKRQKKALQLENAKKAFSIYLSTINE